VHASSEAPTKQPAAAAGTARSDSSDQFWEGTSQPSEDDLEQDAGELAASSEGDQLLSRLRQLELLEDAAAPSDDDDDDDDDVLLGPSTIRIHDQAGGVYGLTANTRLPDAILIPDEGHNASQGGA
jgi:hypothetical protein